MLLKSGRLRAAIGLALLGACSVAIGALGYLFNPFDDGGDREAGEILSLLETSRASGGRIVSPNDGISLPSGEPLEILVESRTLDVNMTVLLRRASESRYFIAPRLVRSERDILQTLVLLPAVKGGGSETWVIVLADLSDSSVSGDAQFDTDSPVVTEESTTFALPQSARLLDARRVEVLGTQPLPTVLATPLVGESDPVRPDSPRVQRLTENEFDDYTPFMLPGGGAIVYSSLRGTTWNLYHLDLETRQETQLTSGGNAWNPSFDPAGSSILFSFEEGGTHSLFRMGIDERSPHRILTSDSNDYHPRQASRTIAFFSDRDQGVPSVFLTDLETSQVRQITDALGSDYWPSWSPDGLHLVFDSNRSGNQDLFLVSVDSGELTQLTTDSRRDAVGSFSPDGQRLVFESARTGTHQIYVMDIRADRTPGDIVQLTDFPLGAYVASFSSDGSTVVFQGQTEKGFEIFAMPFP